MSISPKMRLSRRLHEDGREFVGHPLSIRPSVFVTLCRVVHGVDRVRFRSGLDRIAKGEQSPAEPHKQRVAEERYGQLSCCSLLESLHECGNPSWTDFTGESWTLWKLR
ncbi:MAG: hypothetical protein VX034_04495 [Planctomycetota bacterium]|nr:hypothetical protein [Planctomycetota bacterium]